jgi:protein-disulfide isomerase
LATQALYCGHEKGKFWEVHDLLMTDAGYTLMNTTVKNDKAQADKVADFLKKAVDANFMKGCLEGGKYADRLATDMSTAQQFGFSGTPSFFANTQNFAGAYSYTEMEDLVKKSI